MYRALFCRYRSAVDVRLYASSTARQPQPSKPLYTRPAITEHAMLGASLVQHSPTRGLVFEFHLSEPGGILCTGKKRETESSLGPAEREENLTRFIDIVGRQCAGMLLLRRHRGPHSSTACLMLAQEASPTKQLTDPLGREVAQQHRAVVASGKVIIWLRP